jgi:NTP pyrophosphatase (non-canonical NTP hydrolase)
MAKEEVNHPDRYNKGGIEVIDIIRAYTADLNGKEAFDIGNAIKYICRYKDKNGVEDLKKAIWYINDAIMSSGNAYTKDMEYIRSNIDTYDILDQLAEEAAELSQAALKLKRAMKGTNPTTVGLVEANNRLIEEYSDVCNAANVLGISVDNDICAYKMKRWVERKKGE